MMIISIIIVIIIIIMIIGADICYIVSILLQGAKNI